jgi:hypothetical protein
MLTLATIPVEAYTPSPDKPWRGIWVGDYAGHGYEFVAVLQPDEPIDLPLPAAQRLGLVDEDVQASSDDKGSSPTKAARQQLVGVKLTGDVNVPRGEYSFIVPDISEKATLRYSDEVIFKGARVVPGVGHIAGRGFQSSMYTVVCVFTGC